MTCAIPMREMLGVQELDSDGGECTNADCAFGAFEVIDRKKWNIFDFFRSVDWSLQKRPKAPHSHGTSESGLRIVV